MGQIHSRLASVLFIIIALMGSACVFSSHESETSIIVGLDHIPLAVGDLENAAERFTHLGFTLKPGRYHSNGIQNKHIKFSDGTEIELISAQEIRDPLTAEYLRHLEMGDGPAFVGFYVTEIDKVAEWLNIENIEHLNEGDLVTLSESDEMRYIFFGNRNQSTTDQLEHYDHLNGANSLIGVWIASDNLEKEYQLLSGLGASIEQQVAYVPERVETNVAILSQAEVVFLPSSMQIVPGRRIIGVTIQTVDLDLLKNVLQSSQISVLTENQTENSRSVFISPDIAHGIWLEIREFDDR